MTKRKLQEELVSNLSTQEGNIAVGNHHAIAKLVTEKTYQHLKLTKLK